MATKANINIDQGTTFNTEVSLTDAFGNPLNLSAYTGQAELRTSYSSINSVSFALTLANGYVNLALTANQTSALTRSRYVYDLILTDSYGNITRVLEGVAYVDPAVTHAPYSNTYYTIQLANVQQTFYAGDVVYQSNGSANIVATVYESDTIMLTPTYTPITGNAQSNVAIIKVMNPSGTLAITSNSSTLLYDANTNANATIISITQTTTKNEE